jgi:hypothetical protein
VKYILRRRPSPALVIACLALFVSLSGVSYGVATGFIDSREIKNNTVTSRDVRNNSLRTFDIRNNEVRGFDIRNSSVQGRDLAFNTVTGSDIAEDSLAKVPSAAQADSAAALPSLRQIAPTTIAEGAAPAALAAHGPLTLSAACEPDGDNTEAKLYVQSTENGAAAGGEFDNPSIGPADGLVLLAEVIDLPVAPRTVDDRSVVAMAGATAFTAQLGVLADATGAGSCRFSGHVVLQG